jgi:hypothetical protein
VLQEDGGGDPVEVSHIFSRAVRAGLHPQVGDQQQVLLWQCTQYELLYGTQELVVLNA